MPMSSRPSAICAQARCVEEADAAVPIDGDHAVGRTLKDHRDPSRGFLGLLLRLGQFVLAVLQRIGHGVERVGDPGDFGFIPDVHTPRIFAEPPLVRGSRPIGQAGDG